MQVKKTQMEKEELVIEYSPLIKFIAYRIAGRLPPQIEVDDLISAGAIGLIDAVEKFDPSRDIKFKTYAEFRIRGAILDELRSQDWVSRSIRQKANLVSNLYLELEQKLGRTATDEEMAKSLNIPIEKFFLLLKESSGVSLLSLDNMGPTGKPGEQISLIDSLASGPDSNPQNNARYNEIKQVIANAIDKLNHKEKILISLYYYEELTMKEIGTILDVTESRVSQIHTKAVLKLSGKLQKFIEN